MLDNASGMDLIRLRESVQPGVSAVLEALPTEKGLFIHNEALKDYLDARFGLLKPVAKHGSYLESCHHHLKVDESPEAHALSCVNFGRVTARHDSISKLLINIANRAGVLAPAYEPRHEETGRRGPDVLFPSLLDNGRDVYGDVTFINPLSLSYALRATETDNFAANYAEVTKRSMIAKIQRIPNAAGFALGFSTFGAQSSHVTRLLRELSKHRFQNFGRWSAPNFAAPSFCAYASQLLSIQIAKMNTLCLKSIRAGIVSS